MIVLAHDCSAAACSVAIIEDGALVAHRFIEAERGHAGLLMPLIGNLLEQAGLGFSDPGLYAVTTGPGSYTGIRIGLAAARGMALAAAKPLIGVSATRAVAARIARQQVGVLDGIDLLAVLLETKRDDYYLQCFSSDLRPLTVPACHGFTVAANTLPRGKILAVGNAAGRFCAAASRDDITVLENDHGLPDAHDVALIAEADALAAEIEFGATWPDMLPVASPLYLRAPDVTHPKA